MRYVVAEAVQDVMEAAMTPQLGVTKGGTMVEGKIPVAEGDLIASLRSYNGSSLSGEGEASYTAAVAGFELGDVMTFEWTSEYALRMEYGFVGEDDLGRTYNQPGRHYVGANIKKFPDLIAKHAKEV
ncbi:hypothetical protein [Thioclava sp.]|uniref:hypothetical protein n=1 Tax=Thioclava sp. TaxID=1933450 RepID=UPI003242CCEB